MLLSPTQIGLLIYGLHLAGASERGASFQIFLLRSFRPGPYVSAPGLHNQWRHDSVECYKQLQSAV